MHDLIQVMRREAHHVLGGVQFKGTLVCTAYNPKTHAVKGILVPHEVETGWIPISVVHSGDGYGILAGPRVGSAKDLDGDVFDVEFEDGDRNTPIAKLKHFSAVDQPPEVKSGEILIQHQSGTRDKYAADGSRTMTHANGQTETWDAQGNVATDAKGKTVTRKAGGGMKHDTPKHITTGKVHLAAGGTTV